MKTIYQIDLDPSCTFEQLGATLAFHGKGLRELCFFFGLTFHAVRVGNLPADLSRAASLSSRLPYFELDPVLFIPKLTGWEVSVPVFLRLAGLHHVWVDFYQASLASNTEDPESHAFALWLVHNHVYYAHQ